MATSGMAIGYQKTAARRRQDTTIAKERTTQGRSIWTLSSHTGELEDVAPPAPEKFNTFNTFTTFNTFDPVASCHRTEPSAGGETARRETARTRIDR
jgi:hypothetical protein